jgi:16S rRNA (adenine1518-N6/adenine1519-N6)-dimethyltransferase
MIRPRKRYGQHWLRSQQVLNQIVAAAELEGGDRILEIGPGQGVLTQALLPHVTAVIAVEVDRDLCAFLHQKLAALPNFVLLCGDILSLDLKATLVAAFPSNYPNKVVANIPYNITGPILQRLLGTISAPVEPRFETLVLLIQREVADRLVAGSGSKTFGALSVRVQYLAACELICTVPPQAFQPPPKVESAVVRLWPRPYPKLAQDPRWLEHLVTLGFASRRKMLRNNLKAIVDLEQITVAFEQLSVHPQVRAEDLSVDQWVALSNLLTQSPALL